MADTKDHRSSQGLVDLSQVSYAQDSVIAERHTAMSPPRPMLPDSPRRWCIYRISTLAVERGTGSQPWSARRSTP